MGLPNIRAMTFASFDALAAFITTDPDITTIVAVTCDSSGQFHLLYSV